MSVKKKIINFFDTNRGIDRIDSISFSITTLCNARCVFCPPQRAKHQKTKFMGIELVEKVLNEVSQPAFIKRHGVIKEIKIGDNGEPTLHPNLIDLLRLVELRKPRQAKVILFTNFSRLTDEISQLMMREHLVDRICCNVDGATEKTYNLVKKLDYNHVKDNIHAFIQNRNRYNHACGLRVMVISLKRYIETIYKEFGFYPDNLKAKLDLESLYDDTGEIINYWEQFFSRRDSICAPYIHFMAERKHIYETGADTAYLKKNREIGCPLLNRVRGDIFIIPNGNVDICCFDYDNEIIVGNVLEQSVSEVYYSEHRNNLIQLLAEKKFAEVGGPCSQVIGCLRCSEKNPFLAGTLDRKLKNLVNKAFSTFQ